MMSRLPPHSRIDPERTAEIVTKTEEVIRAYKEAGLALRYVSQVVGELQQIIPDDMCIRLPPGLLNGLPPSQFAFADEIRPAYSPTKDYNRTLYGPQKPFMIPPPLPNLRAQIDQDSADDYDVPQFNQNRNGQKASVEKFKEFIKKEEDDSDCLSTLQSADFDDENFKAGRKSKAKPAKSRHEPYEKPKFASFAAPEPPKEFYAIKMNGNGVKSSPNGKSASSHVSNKKSKSKKKSTVRGESVSDEGSGDKGSPVTHTPARKPAAPAHPLTPEQHKLVDEFQECLEPRLANGSCSQKIIATEIRDISNNASQIVQGTISKMIRRIAVPKDGATIAAIRAWIKQEKAKNAQ